MPLIGFNTPPPSSHVLRDDEVSNPDPLKGKSLMKVVSVGQATTASVTGTDSPDGSSLNHFPLVRLDVDVITDSIAGRLATSLLGHVLFLKNQIPFPVMRLERIPRNQNTNTRVDRLRTEFLTTFDTISSHMDTTFSALSTALSRCSNYNDSTITRAYLAFFLGPSLGSAKSRVVLGIDGLEKRIWGNRENDSSAQEVGGDENEEQDDDSAEEPDESETDGSEEEELEEEESEVEVEVENDHENINNRASSPPLTTYASEQKFLQNAERLLSRTLAAADADGRGIISEMSPTQTHILIRAPRRFDHPAWIPRQNITTTLDAMLYDFLDHSGVGLTRSLTQTKYSKKNHMEGVWITSRAGLQKDTMDEAALTHDDALLKQDDDEMIWWSWEGKLVGFSDW